MSNRYELTPSEIAELQAQLKRDLAEINVALTESGMLAEAKATVINSKNYMTANEISSAVGVGADQLERWKRDKLIFAFNHCGAEYFPLFALASQSAYKPHPAIAEMLSIFDGRKSGWGCAFWFKR